MSSKQGTSLVTDLARARGLGASHTGTEHWWHQRMTSLALLPLTLWFVFSVSRLAGADYVTVKAWLSQPLSATLAILLVAITFHHAAAGMEVIYEDYIQCKVAKLVAVIGTKFACATGAVLCILSVLKLALGG
ncbi:MAG: succinate dehydrogenase, hydrophobic membrane anchor protein [Rhodospirillaceae bacterium]